MLDDLLLEIMSQYGKVDIDVEESIREAVKNECYRFIFRNGKPIGWFTWRDEGDKIYINNLLITERHPENLLGLRRFFRQKYEGRQFYYHNQKRDRIVTRR